MNDLVRTSPEQQGVASQAILDFITTIEQEKLELHSFMLLRHGFVVAEAWWSPYEARRVHLLYSLSKSFTATAVGLAISEGLLSLEDKVVSFFPNQTPDSAGPNMLDMRLKHLLSMATGHMEDPLNKSMQTDAWVQDFLSHEPEQAPGTLFCYNNGATFMLAVILQKLTQQSLLEFLEPRLLKPLGIVDAHWLETSEGIQMGFTGLHLTTEAIAKFGQLYLQRGYWQGQQLIPEAWVELAQSKHIDTPASTEEAVSDWAQGYGFQFWMCQHNAYRADGAFGQFSVIMLEQDAVLATTSGTDNMQGILDAAWSHLLPAMQAEPLAENLNTHGALEHKLRNLTYPKVKGSSSSPNEAQMDTKTYQFKHFKENNSFTPFEFLTITCLNSEHPKQWQLKFKGEQEHEILCAHEQWLESETTMHSHSKDKTLATAAWVDDHTLEVHVHYIETPHNLTIKLEFKEDKIKAKMRWNVRFGDLESADMFGQQVRTVV